MNKPFLNSVLGFVLGCLIVAGAGGGYWYWLQTQKAQPKESVTVRPTAKENASNNGKDAAPTDAKKRPVKKNEKKMKDDAKGVIPSTLTMSRTIAGGDMYTPGQPVDITITLTTEGSDPIRAIGIEERVPAGWRYEGVLEGAKPDITPRNPESQLLEFAWFNIPKFPASFTYRITAGSGAGPVKINGETIFRTSGPENRSGVVNTDLIQSDSPNAAAAIKTNAPRALPAPAKTPPPAAPTADPTKLKPIRPITKNGAVAPTITSDFALSFSGQDFGYKPGVEMPLEFSMDFAGQETLTAFAVSLSLPAGWRFKAVTGGETPAVPPKEGAAGEVALIWINIPQFPTTTQFTITPPTTATGAQNFSGQIVYRTNAGELRSALVEMLIQPGA